MQQNNMGDHIHIYYSKSWYRLYETTYIIQFTDFVLVVTPYQFPMCIYSFSVVEDT